MGLIEQPYDEDLEVFILGELDGDVIRGNVSEVQTQLENQISLIQDYIEASCHESATDVVSDIGEAIYGEGFNYTLDFLAFVDVYAEGISGIP